ncbi:MAG: hypothetical protein ACI4RC_02665 [Oscillospiraceae bacterium]
MNRNKINPQALNTLLGIASKQLGTNPKDLENQLKSGSLDTALKGMPKEDVQKLQNVLSNPKSAEKILSTPQAKAILDKLTKG